MTEPVVQDSAEGAVLTVHVQPKAARTEHVGLHGGALKIRVAAPPAGGAANDEVCRYLAACLEISKASVVVRTGHGSRRKRILLRGISAARVGERFGLPRAPRAPSHMSSPAGGRGAGQGGTPEGGNGKSPHQGGPC